jgi:hypothetical protein
MTAAHAIQFWQQRTNVWRGVTSPVRGKATKPQRTFDCKVKDCSDDDSAPAFGLESTAPIGTRPLQRVHQTNASETTAIVISTFYANMTPEARAKADQYLKGLKAK